MRESYDFVYLTNTPSFYKLNLCNEIAKKYSVLLVLYGYGSEAVNTFLNEDTQTKCDYVFLYAGDANKRNKLLVFIRLLKLMRSITCKKIIYSGWMAPEYNLYSFVSSKEKNVLVCESSILDVSFNGVAGKIKRAIINRMSIALPSGKLHDQLFQSIGFKGRRIITGSVGLFNKNPFLTLQKKRHQPLRYLYVGRLVDVKNVLLLIEEFNKNGKPLTIVGNGYLEKDLKQRAEKNISFTGFIENTQLGRIYQSHDVFILPSYSETWGLVVEEAIYWGLPVIVSDRVGCSVDMVQELGTGIIFKSKDISSLHAAIEYMEVHYDKFYQAVTAVNWTQRDKLQVEAYTRLLDYNNYR